MYFRFKMDHADVTNQLHLNYNPMCQGWRMCSSFLLPIFILRSFSFPLWLLSGLFHPLAHTLVLNLFSTLALIHSYGSWGASQHFECVSDRAFKISCDPLWLVIPCFTHPHGFFDNLLSCVCTFSTLSSDCLRLTIFSEGTFLRRCSWSSLRLFHSSLSLFYLNFDFATSFGIFHPFRNWFYIKAGCVAFSAMFCHVNCQSLGSDFCLLSMVIYMAHFINRNVAIFYHFFLSLISHFSASNWILVWSLTGNAHLTPAIFLPVFISIETFNFTLSITPFATAATAVSLAFAMPVTVLLVSFLSFWRLLQLLELLSLFLVP